MNAITPIAPAPTPDAAAERTAHHLAVCRELIDLGMVLTRAAAAKALQEWSVPEPQAGDPPNPTPEPAQPEPPATPRRIADPGLLFARLSRAVRQAVALECRVAADAAAAANPVRASRVAADPRRPILRGVLADITTNQPDRAQLPPGPQRTPGRRAGNRPRPGTAPLADLYTTVCQELGLDPDYSAMPDATLALFLPENPETYEIPPEDRLEWRPAAPQHRLTPPPPPHGPITRPQAGARATQRAQARPPR